MSDRKPGSTRVELPSACAGDETSSPLVSFEWTFFVAAVLTVILVVPFEISVRINGSDDAELQRLRLAVAQYQAEVRL